MKRNVILLVIAFSLEFGCILSIFIGIRYEMKYEASLGLILITVGSLLAVVGALFMVKVFPLLKKNSGNKNSLS